MKKNCEKFVFTLVLLKHCVYSLTLWSDFNCQDGNVTDIACCNDKHCHIIKKKNLCNQEKTCLWVRIKNEFECVPNKDFLNQVCCLSPVHEYCTSITKGNCPSHFEVPSECCKRKDAIWSRMLKVKDLSHVCCNAPCKGAEDSKCSKSNACLSPILQRSFKTRTSYFNNKLVPFIPTSSAETTIDDLIDGLIRALANDYQSFESSSTFHISNVGKQWFGGVVGFYPEKILWNGVTAKRHDFPKKRYSKKEPNVQNVKPYYGLSPPYILPQTSSNLLFPLRSYAGNSAYF